MKTKLLQGKGSTLVILAAVSTLAVVFPEVVCAAGSVQTLGGIATNLTNSFSGIAKLITGGAYLAGAAFAVGAIMKFKQHRDNPTQIPIGAPIALLFIAAALLYLPTVYKSAGKSIFGSGSASGSLTGVSTL